MLKGLIITSLVTAIVGCSTINPVDTLTTVEPITTPTTTIVETVEVAPTTNYRVTAYCSCERCCGKWALNRPVDENGNEIVIGAAGERLISGVTCASPLPFGTQIELDGYGVVTVNDRTAQWVVDKYGENIVDIYFDTHEQAVDFALQYIEGRVL